MATLKKNQEKSFSTIGLRSFITVMAILIAVLIFSGVLSYFVPQGSYERDESGNIIIGTFEEKGVGGIAPWRVLTAPARVFASGDGITIIMISLFLLIMSGVFNLLDKTNGIKIFIGKIIHRLSKRSSAVICICVFVFMMFGSFFGMFEELVTLVPLVVMLTLSMGMDTMAGLGACMLAACFGFSAAITNPFSVGLASEIAGVTTLNGVWLRVIFFGLIYVTLCAFLVIYIHRIRKKPTASLSYEIDLEKRKRADSIKIVPCAKNEFIFKVFAAFFGVQLIVLVLIASVRAISSYAIPILAFSFLVGGIICGLLVTEKKKDTFKYLLKGAVSMLPAIVMIAFASSVKLVMTESGIIDTIMNGVIKTLDGKGKFLTVLLIYFLILFLQIFIGSASAKIMLIMPIIMPICVALGISPAVVILVYCMADGFTDVIMPTNPVLLIGLSMVNVPYSKWVRWTWKLQLLVFALTILVLFFAVSINY
ncbi:MAG: YfcC family protein [Ruminococcaceae bacterium]|nr:YfcC family protein [Oscillospiraceae bacterium]